MLIESYSKFAGDLPLTILIIGVVQGLVAFSVFPLASAGVVGNDLPKHDNSVVAPAMLNVFPRNPPQSLDTNSKVTEPNFVLAETSSCKDFILRHCEQTSLTNNLEVLECVQNVKRVNVLNNQCQNMIWSYKHDLTKDERFEATAKQICAKLLVQHPECHAKKGEEGQLLYCLMEFTDNSTEESCQSFLKKMEAIVFSDYRLIYKFTTSCQRDISTFQCGRLNSDHDNAPHSQGKTIECLSKKSEKLEPGCRHEILRIAELQNDDFHLDRPLFFACRDDREKFCSRVMSGEGRVYRCLMRHKLDREMSSQVPRFSLISLFVTKYNYFVL